MKKKSIAWLCIIVFVTALSYVVLFGLNIGSFKYSGLLYKERNNKTEETDEVHDNIKKNIDLTEGSVITFQADTENPSEEDMKIAESILKDRLMGKGYTEARISHDNTGKITIEIPSVFNIGEVADILGKVAELTFTDYAGNIVLYGKTDIADAKAMYGKTSEMGASGHYVELTLTEGGVSKFAQATREAAQRPQGQNIIVINLDGEPYSAPMVQEEINSRTCIINGIATQKEAEELANLIKFGQLPFALNIISIETIGA